jgi:hypothetical protein
MTPGIAYFLSIVFSLLALLLFLWRPGPKWWIGVRLPWTFADREIWDIAWVVAGLFCLIIAITVLVSALAFYISLALFLIVCLVHPLYFYRRKYGTLNFWKDVGWIDYRPVVRCRHCGHLQKLKDAANLPAAVCEACGLLCRSR